MFHVAMGDFENGNAQIAEGEKIAEIVAQWQACTSNLHPVSHSTMTVAVTFARSAGAAVLWRGPVQTTREVPRVLLLLQDSGGFAACVI